LAKFLQNFGFSQMMSAIKDSSHGRGSANPTFCFTMAVKVLTKWLHHEKSPNQPCWKRPPGNRHNAGGCGLFTPRVDPSQKPLPPDRKRNRAARKRRKKTGNQDTTFDLRTEAYKLFGVDVTQIPGVETIALPLFGEVGRNLSKWPTGRHFASWLALCPDNDISGGQVLWRGIRKVNNQAGRLFRLAAYSLHHSLTPMGDYLRRMKSKIGPAAATTATAHKIAVVFYTMVKNQVEYDETIWATRDTNRQKYLETKLKRQAKQLGYELVPTGNPAT
jgi:hypothetical protein